MDRGDVEIERDRPVGFAAVEHAAVMHEAGAIDEDVGRPDRPDRPLREHIDCGGRAYVELFAPGRGEAFELAGVEIGPDYRLGDEGLADGAADPLSRGGDDRDLAVQSTGHCLTRTNRW